jgi:hypothetical protein
MNILGRNLPPAAGITSSGEGMLPKRIIVCEKPKLEWSIFGFTDGLIVDGEYDTVQIFRTGSGHGKGTLDCSGPGGISKITSQAELQFGLARRSLEKTGYKHRQ